MNIVLILQCPLFFSFLGYTIFTRKWGLLHHFRTFLIISFFLCLKLLLIQNHILSCMFSWRRFAPSLLRNFFATLVYSIMWLYLLKFQFWTFYYYSFEKLLCFCTLILVFYWHPFWVNPLSLDMLIYIYTLILIRLRSFLSIFFG